MLMQRVRDADEAAAEKLREAEEARAKKESADRIVKRVASVDAGQGIGSRAGSM